MKTRKTARKQAIFLLVIAFTVCLASEAGGIWVEPNSFDVNITEGCTTTKTLTIGNDGIEDLDFMIRTRQVGNSGDSEATAGVSTAQREGIHPAAKGRDFTVADDVPYKSGELIVRFAVKADGKLRSLADKNQILSSMGGGNVKRNFNIVPGLSLVELPAGMTVEQALPVFNKASGILYAEPDYEVQICSTFPDDTRFNDLWGMHNTGQTGGTEDADIDAPEAWDIGTGSSEIVVAVIDTGVDYTHVDLAANMWVNEAEYSGAPGVDDDGNGYVDDIYGYDFRNNDGNPMDDHYHGTHCAGTVGGIGNNAEGVAGVNWNVRIMALKFLSSGGSGWTSDAIDCVEYSTLMGANLSSNSWGGGGYSQGLKDAIDAAGAANMLFVAAAGNSGVNTDNYSHYPSSYDCESLVAVMSTDSDDARSVHPGWWASNYGAQTVDLGAPGSSVLSCKLGGGYKYASGTSMATPHVAGACALLWSMNPAMGNDEVKDILLQTVDETLPGLCVSEGRLNLYNAILETKAPWIEIEPQEGTIGPDGTVDVNVTFDAMELAPGTYGAEIVIISNDPCSPTIVPVTMTVNPDDLQVVPADGFESSGAEGGPFEPECVVYTLTNNNDTQSVNWTTWESEDWLAVEPNEGVLDPCDSIEVSVCISPDANLLDPNIYTEILTFQNTDSGSIKPRSISLTVKPADCFTESFGDSGGDLGGLMLTFSPDGSGAYYEACREEVDGFPTDPNGGTFVPLGDDDFAEVFLGGQNPRKKVWFYGTQYNRFYIGSNGYITFGDGDTEYSASLENHFNMLRISGVFTDLTPPDVQCISYKKLGDRVAVTFENVPIFGDKDATNSFQIEIFYVDGTIRITWLKAADTPCVAGLSRGRGIPPVFFEESELNKYPPCWPWCDLNRDYFVNFADFAMFAKHWLDEDCGVPYWCGKSDLDLSGETNTDDLGIFSESWLTKVDWFLQPISHWKFDEGEGDIAYDSAGDNDGTLMGDASWVAGKIGDYALDFDGDDAHVLVPDSDSISVGNQDYTISVWINPRSLTGPDGAGTIVSKVKDDSDKEYRLLLIDGNLWFDVEKNANNQAAETTTAPVQTDSWQHIAVTFNSSTTTPTFYYNGAVQTSTSNIDTLPDELDNDLYIGMTGGTYYTNEFNGTIDDVRIYDRALSAEEIWQLYQDGLGNKAFAPNPADGATGVDPNTVLSWSPGKDALSHDVYLGTGFNDVNDANTSSAVYMGNFDVNSFDPCGLELETTYYWRIDELDGSNTYKGDVWSFTTWEEFDPNLGLVGWWEFEEGEGTIAYDSAGDNDGTLQGEPNWVVSNIGGHALDFNGVDDYVNINDSEDLDISGCEITIAAWIKANEINKRQVIAAKTAASDNTWLVGINPVDFADGTLDFYLAAGGTEGNFGSSDTISVDIWYHVAFVYDGTNRIIYIDGETSGSQADSGNIATNNQAVKIGAWGSLSQYPRYFDGTIDDVRIYDRALSAGDIWQLYQDGLGE